ncbi:MAG: hypothetical protein AB1637_04800 [Elusimicrobiota bacterium]
MIWDFFKNTLFSPSKAGEKIDSIKILFALILFLAGITAESASLFLTPSSMLKEAYSSSISYFSAAHFFFLSFISKFISTAFFIPAFLSLMFFFSKSSLKKIIIFTFLSASAAIFLLSFPSFYTAAFSLIFISGILFFIIRNKVSFLIDIFKIYSLSSFITSAYIFLWGISVLLSSVRMMESSQIIWAIWTAIYFSSACSSRFKISIPKVFASLIFASLYIIFIVYMLKTSDIINSQIFEILIMQG